MIIFTDRPPIVTYGLNGVYNCEMANNRQGVFKKASALAKTVTGKVRSVVLPGFNVHFITVHKCKNRKAYSIGFKNLIKTNEVEMTWLRGGRTIVGPYRQDTRYF